jgi:hypothetical protein
MEENWLQIRGYDGEGFQPLIFFHGWQVAILNYLDDIRPERNDTMERHTETDEVFVLMKGRGILLIGGNGSWVEGVFPQAMDIGKIYNVRRDTWHTILLSRDATVLIIENGDTGAQNSEFASLSEECRGKIMKIAQHERFEG